MQTGIITKGIGGFYYVLSDGEVFECKARGVFRKEKITPMVGDNVEIEAKGDKGSIVKILPRKNELLRPPVANVDTLVVVVAATSPEPNLMLIDKMLVYAEKCGITAVICINKTDLTQREDIRNIYESAGYRVICTSAEMGENLDELKELINGRITAFSGLSGVGKSSILNILTDANMETGSLSTKIDRGKHTTRHVELISISDGFVFDTPGFSSLEIPEISLEELSTCFPEIEKYSHDCKFRGCSHTKDQGCAVKAAVENGEISPERYKSYCEMAEIIKSRKIY